MALQRDIRNWWAVPNFLNTLHTLAVTYFAVTVGTLIHFFRLQSLRISSHSGRSDCVYLFGAECYVC